VSRGRRALGAGLCAAFVCSGAGALLFESLWFRLAGLGLGNSVWASSAVLAAFMAGLALGNALAARLGGRVERPLRLFAGLEAIAAVLSLLLVLALPSLGGAVAPALGALGESSWLARLALGGVAFLLMLLPASAMGASLPLLARALAARSESFGVALGRLYGWNTLGGVLGALSSETLLVPTLGLARSAGVAVALQLAGALLAFALDARYRLALEREPEARDDAAPARLRRGRLLAAAFMSGAVLLALEVVWFRFLQLFVFGTQRAFALMLATILAGIALGGLAAAAWLRRRPRATLALPFAALLGAIATVTSYAGFDPRAHALAGEAARVLWLSLALMLPASLVSGGLFTLIGAAVRDEAPGDAAAAGWLTLANTFGAALGAPLAGLVLLPWLGVERSLFGLALVYGAAALALGPWAAALGRPWRLAYAGLYALVLALFPFGLMQGHFLRKLVESMAGDGVRVMALRESQTETAILLRTDWGGAPFYDRLLTNAHSMTSSVFYGRRYMKLFAYWPLALRPEAKRALLISYGIGNTAEALVRAPGLGRIDVVDISSSILSLSPLVDRAGAADPLGDPRVKAHVEDGRFFLRTQGSPYDVITAEPPPPLGAGVASLYSREYFELVRSRLAQGGLATHWLPVNQLSLKATRAVIRAFCAVFEDCTLWSGAGYDWMLAGTRAAAAPSVEGFGRLWADPRTAADLLEIGIERPEQLGALFIADAPQLLEWTAGALPLVDDRPGRLDGAAPGTDDAAAYRAFQESEPCAQRFRASQTVRRLWPPPLRERTLSWFAWQGVFNRNYDTAGRSDALAELWQVLSATKLETLPLLLLGSEPRIRATARSRHLQGGVHPALAFHLGAAALADRDYEGAARFFATGVDANGFFSTLLLRALALGLAGHRVEALAAVESIPAASLPPHAGPWRDWLHAELLRRATAAAPERLAR
jgi:predicted membrane-bound spermidine synthase